MDFLNRFRRRRPAPVAQATERQRVFLTDPVPPGRGRELLESLAARAVAALPAVPAGVGMDANNGQGVKAAWNLLETTAPEALLGWFSAQGWLGHQLSAIIAQHWLVDKACTMPARDAVRHGFDMNASGLDEDGNADVVKRLHKANKRLGLNRHMQEFVRKGRIFGIRVLLYDVRSDDPNYYEYPFNIDGVTPGSYRGMIQVDPYWCVPLLDSDAASDPASPDFYTPTWWQINGKRYHRSHLRIFRTSDVPDILKPAYNYGGIPVPQRIYERVYAAERTANEAPQLAMSKRTLVWNTDLAELLANQDKFAEHMAAFVHYRDNFGIKINDTDDTMAQFETSLNDLDAVIMTQYQIVAAAANVPATKLLGTTPKGFNATGEYEEASYHEELETIQANDLDPMLERHLELVLRSDIEPELGLAPGTLNVTSDWNPVDSPTAKEYAEINKLNAETDAVLVGTGAIDGMDVRARIRSDKNGPYTDLPEVAPLDAVTGALDPLAGDPLAPADPLAPDPLASDAKPRPLYVRRNLLNGAEFIRWAKAQGFKSVTTADDLHVTITYSRQPVDWLAMGDAWSAQPDGKLTVPAGGPRVVEPLGDKGAVVLTFASADLTWRNARMRELGASWDYPEYQPHVTITYDGGDVDLEAVEPFRGRLVFGPEIFEELTDNWRPREA